PTPEQENLVREDALRRAYEARRQEWESYDSRQASNTNSPVPPHWRGSSYRPWSRGPGRAEENSEN
ncbi:MAG: hypothetical protein ACRDTH_22655, partial [Pseudonocardiaceae bacterium]